MSVVHLVQKTKVITKTNKVITRSTVPRLEEDIKRGTSTLIIMLPKGRRVDNLLYRSY